MVAGERSQELTFGGLGCAAPQLRENNRTVADEPCDRINALLVSSTAQVVYEN